MATSVKKLCLCIADYRRAFILILTPLLLLILLPFHDSLGLTLRACNCLYMMLLMAVYWCTEALPLAGTALIPLVLAPTMGILDSASVCKNYFKDKIALFIGGLAVATAMQHSDLHRRIALTFIKIFGTNPRFLTLGFMIPTWFLSMWISNTATTAMMVSIVNCVIFQLERQSNILSQVDLEPDSCEMTFTGTGNAENNKTSDLESACDKRFLSTAKCLSLAVCYSATCGGIATLTGTGTNLIFYDSAVEVGKKLNYDFDINLPKWMLFAFPLSLIILTICWVWLQVFFFGVKGKAIQSTEERELIASIIKQELSSLGDIKWREVITLIHFIALTLLWLTRNVGGSGGWENVFAEDFVTDATAAILIMVSLLLMPKYPPKLLKCFTTSQPYEPLLPWKVVSEKLSWGTVFLIAGGFALADCVHKSGLSAAIGESLSFVSTLPVWAMIMVLCFITAVITEFTSNVAICALFVPIIADLAIGMRLNPLQLMIPVSVAASFAFMLPAATPPNAIVYSSGYLKIKDMVVAGVLMNLTAIILVTLSTVTWAPEVFDFESFSYGNSSSLTSLGGTNDNNITAVTP